MGEKLNKMLSIFSLYFKKNDSEMNSGLRNFSSANEKLNCQVCPISHFKEIFPHLVSCKSLPLKCALPRVT